MLLSIKLPPERKQRESETERPVLSDQPPRWRSRSLREPGQFWYIGRKPSFDGSVFDRILCEFKSLALKSAWPITSTNFLSDSLDHEVAPLNVLKSR